jgi:hypothetical protein
VERDVKRLEKLQREVLDLEADVRKYREGDA